MPPEKAYIDNLRIYHKFSEELHQAAVADESVSFSYYLASLFVVVEGFKDKYKLTDPEIDELIASPFYDRLRRFRNAIFHVQRDFFCQQTNNLLDLEFLGWIKLLRGAIFVYFNIKNPPTLTQTVTEFMRQVECHYEGTADEYIVAVKEALSEILGGPVTENDHRVITSEIASAAVEAGFVKCSTAAGASVQDTMKNILSRMRRIDDRIARAKAR